MRIIGVGGRQTSSADLTRIQEVLRGGRRGQALYKQSDDPYDVGWYDEGDGPPSTVPDTITDLIGSPGEDRVLLSWTSPDSGGSPITDYVIRYSNDNFVSDDTVFADGINLDTLVFVTGLDAETQYWFKVEPVNANGAGTSNVITVTTTAASNSERPVISMVEDILYVSENQPNVTIQVACDIDPTETINVALAISGTATPGADFQTTNLAISFIPGGSLIQSVTIPLIDDESIEEDETLEFTITGATNADIGGDNITVVNLSDNDLQTVGFNTTSINATEGTTVTVRVDADKVSPFDLTIPITVSGTVNGEDYQFIGPQSVTIQEGELFGTFDIVLIDDKLSEGLESLILDLNDPVVSTQYALNQNKRTALIRIGDTGNSASLVGFQEASLEGDEGTTVEMIITVTPVDPNPITLTLVNGGATTATAGVDWQYFKPSGGSITIPANTPSYSVPILLLDDEEADGEKLVEFNISGLSGTGNPELGNITKADVLINDTDVPAPVIAFESFSTAAQEPDNVGEINSRGIKIVNTGGVSEDELILRISIDGTATYQDDFTFNGVSNVATDVFDYIFPANATEAFLQVDLIGDSLEEGEENIIIDIDAVTNSETGGAVDTGPITSHEFKIFDFIPARQEIPATADITVTATTVACPSLGINETWNPGDNATILARAVQIARTVWLNKNAGNEELLDQTFKEGEVVRIDVNGDITSGSQGGTLQLHGGNVNAQNTKGSWGYLRTEVMTNPFTGNQVQVEIGEVIRDIVFIGAVAGAENNKISNVILSPYGAQREIIGNFSSPSHDFFGRYDNIRFENLTFNKSGSGRDTISGQQARPRFWESQPDWENNRQFDPTGRGSGSIKIYDCIQNAFSGGNGTSSDPNDSSYNYAHGKFGIRSIYRFRWDVRNFQFYPNDEHSMYIDSVQATEEMPCIFMGTRQLTGPPVPNHPTAPGGITGNSTTHIQLVNRQGDQLDGTAGDTGRGPVIFFDCIARSNCSPDATALRGGADFTSTGHDGVILYKDCQSLGNAFSNQNSSQRGLLTCWNASAHEFVDTITGKPTCTRGLIIDNYYVNTDGQRRTAINLRGIADLNIVSFDMSDSTDWGAQHDIQFNVYNSLELNQAFPNLRVTVPDNFGTYSGWAEPNNIKVRHAFTENLENSILLTPAQLDVYDGSDPV